jgi:hypothetical protein
MYANHPELAKEFQKKTPKGARLPEKVKTMDKTANSQCVRGIYIEKHASAGAGMQALGFPGTLAAVGTLAGLAGAGTGYGLARATSPGQMSIDNLRKEEQVANYDVYIQKLRDRIAIRRALRGL